MSGIKTDSKTETLDKNFLPRSASFNFKCTQCGQCCRNVAPADKVLISTVDLFRIAVLQGIEMTEVIEKYCDMVPGGESMLPLLVMRERLDGSCIFLKKGKCTVHEAKPLACALHPLGRIDIYDDETDSQDFHYYLKETSCPAERDQSVTVQEWLDAGDVERYDSCVRLYKRMASVCSKIMHALKTDDERREMFSTAFFMMYAKYDIKGDLRGQLAQNLAFIQSINPKIAFDKSKLV